MDRSKLVFLLVDDNYTMLALMMPMLQGLGYTKFVTAGDGLDAWHKLNHEDQIHIVLSDLIMPKLNGVELLTKIRESEKFWDMPFVMITGDENQDRLMSSIEVDINSYIIKPFTPEKLAKEINSVLKEKYDPSPYHQAMYQGQEMLFRQNELDAAWPYFENAIEMYPLEADPYYFQAIILERQGKIEGAKEALGRCMRLRKSHTKAYDLLALIYHREKNYKEEARVLGVVTELSPNNLSRHVTLGKACAMLNDKSAVKKALVNASKLARVQGKTRDREFMTTIFKTYLEIDGLADDAEAIYRKYIDSRMDHPRLLNRYAMILKENRSYDMAIHFSKRIVNIWRTVKRHDISSDDMTVYYLNLSVAYVERAKIDGKRGEARRSDYAKAREAVDKALDCNPRHANAMKLLAWLDKRLCN